MFKENLESNSYIENSKGGLYYKTTYNANLDLFTLATRYKDKSSLIRLFDNAFNEDTTIALAILLFNLDIRGGKGERRVFKTLFHHLCTINEEYALKILYLIPELGRYDYILETYQTKLWNKTLEIIKSQLNLDLANPNPSLLAKWLPSVRTHNVNNMLAINLAKDLGLSPKDYRKTLSLLRKKINIVEHNITNKTYSDIDYERVPSIAINKYANLFKEKDEERFNAYINAVRNNQKKINTSVIEPYQIIKRSMNNANNDVLDEIWKNQTDVLDGDKTNALVIADTSGSMWSYDRLPISCALGLAIYIAERNQGIFHNTFINFSDNPTFQKLNGDTLSQKLNSIDYDNWGGTTNIDKALELIQNASISSSESECPSHLIIISDMEFDRSFSKIPNYKHWQKEYENHNLKMPKIVFWCISPNQMGIPITKNDGNAIAISGFTPKIFKGILNLDEYSPVNAMLEVINKYIEMLK